MEGRLQGYTHSLTFYSVFAFFPLIFLCFSFSFSFVSLSFLPTFFEFQLSSTQPILSYFSLGKKKKKKTPPNLLLTPFLNYIQVLMLWVGLVLYWWVMIYMKVIGFRLGSDE